MICSSPYRRRRGLPIGNLTSQFFANLYLDRFDHWVSEKLGAPYVRYVDDFALFHDDPDVLADWRERIERYLEGRRLKLHPRKTVILPTAEPAHSSASSCTPGRASTAATRRVAASAGCPRTTSPASAIGSAVCATAGAPVPSRGRRRGPHRRLDRARRSRGHVLAEAGDVRGRLVRAGAGNALRLCCAAGTWLCRRFERQSNGLDSCHGREIQKQTKNEVEIVRQRLMALWVNREWLPPIHGRSTPEADVRELLSRCWHGFVVPSFFRPSRTRYP